MSGLAPVSRLEHTLLRPEATAEDIRQLVAEALRYGFATVCVNGAYVSLVAKALHGSSVKTCTVVGFPLGASPASVKAQEAAALVREGAQEIDFVAFLPAVLACDLAAQVSEYRQIVYAARQVNAQVQLKVIIETALLMTGVDEALAERRIATACRAAAQAGCNFIKTSTGFHPAGGATVRAVELIRRHSQGLLIKAAGGIRTAADARRFLEAGADRLGTSSAVAIVQGWSAAYGRT